MTDVQRAELAALLDLRNPDDLVLHQLGGDDRRLLHLDLTGDLGPQLTSAITALGVTDDQWDSDALYLIVPDLAPAAAIAVAHVHGRSRFPVLVWRSADPGGEGFRIAGLIDLRGYRDHVRQDSLA